MKSRLYIALMFYVILISSCFNLESEKDEIQYTLESIPYNTPKDSLEKLEFSSFIVEWDTLIKYESSCGHYDVIPRTDTFKYQYHLDFCYDRYNGYLKIKIR